MRSARGVGGTCCLVAVLLCWGGNSVAQRPAFSGAEGYGGVASASGFSNATLYRVTNLNDSGPGSFRDAFDENSANKIIIFDVAGTINLQSKLDIKNLANYYIAGQSAPGPVTVYGDMVQLTHSNDKENRDVVLRYLSFRKGTGDNSDSITFAGGGLGTNLILDHVSASWSEDEILSVANNNTNVTVQYSMINDALVNNHAYGSLIRPRISSNVTFHHNLYAHNASRQARFGTYNGELLTADFRNNVVYNWRDRASYSGGSSESDREFVDVNFVGNYLVAGPGTNSNASTAFVVDKNVTTRAYQSGNFIDPDRQFNPSGEPNGADTGWGMFHVQTGGDKNGTLEQMGSPFSTPAVTTQTAGDAYWQVVNHVGNWWWDRDAIDERVINNVLTNTGPMIGASAPNATELSSLLTAPMLTHPAGWDSDADGMPDEWELKHGLNPNSASDWRQDFAGDGYTNLEHYLNEVGAFPATAPIVFEGGANNRYAQITNWRTDDGGVTTGTHWQPSRFDVAQIRQGTVVVDTVGQHAGLLQIGPRSGDDATLELASGWLEAHTSVEVGSATGAGRLQLGADVLLVAPAVYASAMGTIAGDGEILGNVFNSGLVSPGTSTGQLSLDGDLMQDAQGTLRMEIASATEYDRLVMDGAFMAGGSLEIDLLGYTPEAGDAFDLLDFASASGSIQIALPELSEGLSWDPSQFLNTGTLSVVSAVENADFDGDGDVDGNDFLVWQRGFGNAGSLADGDANGDGNVNAVDLVVWESQFGGASSMATSHVVPEPRALSLALGSLLLLFAHRRANT